MATLINFPVEGGGLSVDLNNADSGTVPYTNADMLGGVLANQYALKSDIKDSGIKTVAGVAPDSNGNVALNAGSVGAATATHTHGKINSNGAISGVTQPMLLITDSSGNIIASRTFGGDITVNGTITANKVVGAVYA